jgi:hypothetical protein
MRGGRGPYYAEHANYYGKFGYYGRFFLSRFGLCEHEPLEYFVVRDTMKIAKKI